MAVPGGPVEEAVHGGVRLHVRMDSVAPIGLVQHLAENVGVAIPQGHQEGLLLAHDDVGLGRGGHNCSYGPKQAQTAAIMCCVSTSVPCSKLGEIDQTVLRAVLTAAILLLRRRRRQWSQGACCVGDCCSRRTPPPPPPTRR